MLVFKVDQSLSMYVCYVCTVYSNHRKQHNNDFCLATTANKVILS